MKMSNQAEPSQTCPNLNQTLEIEQIEWNHTIQTVKSFKSQFQGGYIKLNCKAIRCWNYIDGCHNLKRAKPYPYHLETHLEQSQWMLFIFAVASLLEYGIYISKVISFTPSIWLLGECREMTFVSDVYTHHNLKRMDLVNMCLYEQGSIHLKS